MNPSPSRKRGCTIAAVVAVVLGVSAMCLLCAVPFVGGGLENAGPTALSEVGPDWTVEGQPQSRAADIAHHVNQDCTPMKNGLAVLFHHAWYNTMTSGYDDTIWLEGPEGSYDSLGLYRSHNVLFVRDETTRNGYNNQVLICDGRRFVP